MKFKFQPRTEEHRDKNLEWKNILLQRKLLAAAESSSSAATGRNRNTDQDYSTTERKYNT